MQQAFIHYKNSQFHYSYGGKGKQTVLCLHGYGEAAGGFHFLARQLPEQYGLLALDLPFHGKTNWREQAPFTITDLLQVLQQICATQQLPEQYIVIGYSMGGRVALCLAAAIPQQVKKLVLIAPDGLHVNTWYWLATQTRMGNRFFRFTMQHPHWFFFLLRAGKKLGLIDRSIEKFARYYIQEGPVRQALYDRWTCMRTFTPALSLLKNTITRYQLPVRLLFGQYDRIIQYKQGEKLKQGIESLCTLQVIASGHQLLQEKHAPVIHQLIQS